MKKEAGSGVFVSKTDLAAMKNLLYGGEGVDMEWLISDITSGKSEEDKLLTELRIGMQYRGMYNKPTIGEQRIQHNYGNRGWLYTMTGRSYINGTVSFSKIPIILFMPEFQSHDSNGELPPFEGHSLCYYHDGSEIFDTESDIEWDRLLKVPSEDWVKEVIKKYTSAQNDLEK